MENQNLAKNGDMGLIRKISESDYYSTDLSGVLNSSFYKNGYFEGFENFHVGSKNCDAQIEITQCPVEDLPGFSYCMKIECTRTQTTVNSNSVFNIQQRFSGKDLLPLRKGYSDAEDFTISFYAKSDKPAIYSVELFDMVNRRHIVRQFSVRRYWERISLSFPGDSIGKLTHENSRSLDLLIWLHSGSDFRGGTFSSETWLPEENDIRVVITDSIVATVGSTFWLTGLQVETGTHANPFQHTIPNDTDANSSTKRQKINTYDKQRRQAISRVKSEIKVKARISDIWAAFSDIKEGLAHWRIWAMLAWRDNLLRYKRTVLGPFWVSANMLVLLLGMGLVFSTVLGVDIEKYLPYLASGIITWGLLTAAATESCEAFVQQQQVINSVNLPFTVHVFRFVARAFIVFLHNALIFIPLALFLNVEINTNSLLALVGIMLILLNVLWLSLALATLGSRYRDINPIMASLFQLMFFLTPIIWDRTLLPGGTIWVDFNPLFHLVEVLRAPLLGTIPSPISYYWVTGLAFFGLLFSFACFARYRRSLAFWL